ncbi:hypothetical protein M8312_04830 [Sphingomonas sp. KRR8]|uniref:hypothetical protein n=1 Tax=Sphingomonas sp. KRR8 TaxID=2942996 RepID=UPI0020214DF3|nr:hypothetical protein [Sphingomonas sp. KRR8]URD61840.1 hypothetical protein M8312_04830 [Sphingomonas sp. KRR8]
MDAQRGGQSQSQSQSRTVALPPLGRRALTLFRIIWFASFALALVALAVGQYRDYRMHEVRPFSRLGLGWYTDNGELRLSDPLTKEAQRAGIVRGLRIVAVDGRNVSSLLSDRAVLESHLVGPENQTVVLTTRSPQGTLRDHRLTRTARNLDEAFVGTGMTSNQELTLETALRASLDLLMLAGGVLLFRAARSSTLAALLAIGLVLLVATGPETWQFWLTGSSTLLHDSLATAGALALFTGLFVFPDGEFRPRWTLWAAGVSACLIVADTLLPEVFGRLMNLFDLAIILAIAAAAVQRYNQLPDGRARQQIRWAVLGFIWSIPPLALASLLAVLSSDRSRTDATAVLLELCRIFLDSAGFGCILLGVIVSVLRYRLYDVDALLSRSAAYGVLTIIFLGLFAGLEHGLEISGEHWFGGSTGVAGGVAAGLAAVIVVPMHNRVHGWAERRFQRRLTQLGRDLKEHADDWRDSSSLEMVADNMVTLVLTAVRASYGAILADERLLAARGVNAEEVTGWTVGRVLTSNGARLDCDRSDPLFPMRVGLSSGDGCARWLLLGPRPDGSFYGTDEQDSLREAAPLLGRVLTSVSVRSSEKVTLEERLRTIESAVNRLAKLAGA